MPHYMIALPIGGRRFKYAKLTDAGEVKWEDDVDRASIGTADNDDAAWQGLKTPQNRKLYGPDAIPMVFRGYDGVHCTYCSEATLRHVGTERGTPLTVLEYQCTHCNMRVGATFRFEKAERLQA